MTHGVEGTNEKNNVWQGSSTILLPADWFMLRVAKLLHCFAGRYTPFAPGECQATGWSLVMLMFQESL